MGEKIFGKGYYKTFREGIEREWVTTNGIGGYAGSSIIGAHTRKHHGMLIASLHAPTERYMVLSKVDESVSFGNKSYSFGANQRVGGKYENGQQYLQRFIYNKLPSFVYHVNGMFVTKTISFEFEKNTMAIGYEIENGPDAAVMTMVPFFNFRDHNNGSALTDLIFDESVEGQEITLTPKAASMESILEKYNHQIRIHYYTSEGHITAHKQKFDTQLELQTELDTGMSSTDNNYTPYEITFSVAPFEKKKVSVICSIEKEYEKDAFFTIDTNRNRIKKLVEQADLKDDFANDLVQAADNFIVKRASTGYKTVLAGLPWFTDWGRDTMIALQGLTLVTKRYEDAKGILKTFAQYVHNGLVPNMFPDEGLEPLYNTVDASLWYFYSVDRFLAYTGDYEFVEKEIYPKLEEIIAAYQKGTDFSIYMEEDGLIHSGGGLDQVTWMDVRVGEWVVTPRHGKAVEINALWYNALKVMESLAKRFGKEPEQYINLAEKVKESFNARFWNEEKQCLYDVVDEHVNPALANPEEKQADDKTDKKADKKAAKKKNQSEIYIQDNAQIRPNQIWAVSLPYTMLPEDKAKKVVNKVLTHLYGSYGLRSLSPEDAAYKGIYFGKLHDRDAAYHQGTVWGFPMGGLISAYVKVNHHSKEAVEFARKLMAPVADHLTDGCIGSVAEIFDGDEPHISRGCYAQAWSVGEMLRAYVEDILNV